MTVEQLELKKWLNRAFHANNKVKALEPLIKQCRERAQSLSICYEGNDKGKSDTSVNDVEIALMKLEDMKRKAERQKIEATNISSEIQDAIAMLHDDELETVLIYRYMLFHTIEEIAELMNYHPNTVKNKINKAVQKLVRKCLEMSVLNE